MQKTDQSAEPLLPQKSRWRAGRVAVLMPAKLPWRRLLCGRWGLQILHARFGGVVKPVLSLDRILFPSLCL